MVPPCSEAPGPRAGCRERPGLPLALPARSPSCCLPFLAQAAVRTVPRYGRSRGAEGPPGAGAAVMAAGSRVLPLAVLALLPLAAAVYEDQVGKFDW